MTFLLAGACCLLSLPAAAQSSTRTSGRHTPPTVAPPPDEPGTTTIQLANGFIRYRTDDVDETDDDAELPSKEDEGTLSVMPRSRETVEPSKEVKTPEPVAAAAVPMAAPPVVVPRAQEPVCIQERALLAQRLLQTRGVYLDPASALITLPQYEVPFSPLLTRSVFGAMTPYLGGTLMSSAISWDTETQQLTQKLANCLLR
jgi:hypothetical protein